MHCQKPGEKRGGTLRLQKPAGTEGGRTERDAEKAVPDYSDAGGGIEAGQAIQQTDDAIPLCHHGGGDQAEGAEQ